MARATAHARRHLGRVFYGWWIVVGGFVVQALGGGLLFHSFGAYFVYLQGEFGWSRTLISGAFSAARLESGVLGPIQAWLINRFGSQAIIRIGLVVFALGFFLISRIESVIEFYGAFLLLALGSGLGGFLTVNIVLANWFERRRAMAMALAATGGSIAGVMVPGVAWALSTFGWRTTALASGLIVLLVGLPVAQLIRQAPEPYGYEPDGAPVRDPTARTERAASTPAVASPRGLPAHTALRTPAFWFLTLGHASALVAVSALMAHLIPFLVDQAGMSVEAAAGVVAALTALSVVGQVVAGFIGDRFDKRQIATVCMAGHTIALLILAMATTLLPILAFAVLHGLAWGVRGPLMAAVRADYFGRRAFATIEGFALLVTMLGLVVGPLLVGIVADRLGDYRLAFLLLAFVTAAGGLFFLSARRPAAPDRRGPRDSHPSSRSSP